MNILMVTERYVPIWGGAENQLKQLIPHLTSCGCTVRVVTRRWHRTMPPTEYIDGTLVFRLGIPGTGLVATSVFILALLFFTVRHRAWIDILHSHGAVNMGALCWAVARLLRKKNVAKIASAGRIPPLSHNAGGRFLLSFFKKSDAIISMTDEIDGELEAIGVDQRKVKRIVNGVDGQRFHPYDNEERTRIRSALNIDVDAPLLLFSSRLAADKGLRVLLDAWPEIHAKYAQAWLFIVGSGANQKNSIEEEAKRKAELNNLPHLKFLGETSTPEEFLGAADIFVFPSRKEGFPNALMEALVAGLPVVASDIGGVREIIKNQLMGRLFAAGNAEDLVKKATEVLSDLESAKERAKTTRRYMMENFSFSLIASSYFSLYSELLVYSSRTEWAEEGGNSPAP